MRDPLLGVLDRAGSLNARVWAAQILGRLGDHRATWPLVERLHDRAEPLRLSAANALAELGALAEDRERDGRAADEAHADRDEAGDRQDRRARAPAADRNRVVGVTQRQMQVVQHHDDRLVGAHR